MRPSTTATSFVDENNRGICDSGLCAIWDWSLNGADTVIRGIHGQPTDGAGCPAAAQGNEAILDSNSSPQNVYMSAALEVAYDDIGDEDGLCESGEACIFSPSPGSYKGEGDPLGQSCTVTPGLVGGVTMYFYTTTGG